MPLRVLGVDSSLTATGLSLIDVPGSPVTDKLTILEPTSIQVATVGAPKPRLKTRREYSRRVSHVVESVAAAMEGVDLIMMEELAYGAKGDTAFVLPWIWGRIIDAAEERDIPIGFANIQQVKKYATGKGNADKDIVLAAMVRRFPDVAITNNNESDALTLGLIGCRARGYPIDHPTIHKEEVMAKLGAICHE